MTIEKHNTLETLVQSLIDINLKTTRQLYVFFGITLSLALFIVNHKFNPEEGFTSPLVGSLIGIQLLGYFLAWRPYYQKRLKPFHEMITEEMKASELGNKR